MTHGTALYKVPGGKLVRVELFYGDRIEQVRITGDFFLHPEEALEAIEAALTGVPLPPDNAALTARLAAVLAEQGATLFGAAPADLVTALTAALANRAPTDQPA